MAKNEGQKRDTVAARQAPAEVWTPESLLDALRSGEEGDKIAALKAAGITGWEGEVDESLQELGDQGYPDP